MQCRGQALALKSDPDSQAHDISIGSLLRSLQFDDRKLPVLQFLDQLSGGCSGQTAGLVHNQRILVTNSVKLNAAPERQTVQQ